MKVTESNIWRVELWQAIIESLNAKSPPFSLSDPTKQRQQLYYKSHMTLELEMAPSRDSIYCGVWIQGDNKDSLYDRLEAQKEVIEAELRTEELGTKVVWMPKRGQRSASILLEATINAKDPANRDKVIAWYSENAIPFYNTFRRRIDALAGAA